MSMGEFKIVYVNGHYDIYSYNQFLFSEDTYEEALRDIEEIVEE